MGRTVVVQARVSEAEAAVVQADAAQLGLEGISEAVREGLALLHRRAQLTALAQSYDEFFGGEPAPLSDVTMALITCTQGPGTTHTVPVARCRTFRRRLTPAEMGLLEDALALTLGLPPRPTPDR
jgi:hypothetical protein